MKNLLTKLLLLAANLYCYALCWGVYWLCFAWWWLVAKGTPAAWRWSRDKALPRLGELLLALALDAVAFVVWMAWLIHDPGAATRQTREGLIHAGASAAAWLVSLADRAVAGANYRGKCRRPALCPVAAGVGLPETIELTDFAGNLVPVIEASSPSAHSGEAGNTPGVEAVAGDHETAPASPVEFAPAAEHELPLLAYLPAVPAVSLLTYDPSVGQAVSAPANFVESVAAPEPTRETEPPTEAEEPITEKQPSPSPSRHPELTAKPDDVVAEALALLAGGMSRRAVAKALGVAESTLRARLRKAASVPVAA